MLSALSGCRALSGAVRGLLSGCQTRAQIRGRNAAATCGVAYAQLGDAGPSARSSSGDRTARRKAHSKQTDRSQTKKVRRIYLWMCDDLLRHDGDAESETGTHSLRRLNVKPLESVQRPASSDRILRYNLYRAACGGGGAEKRNLTAIDTVLRAAPGDDGLENAVRPDQCHHHHLLLPRRLHHHRRLHHRQQTRWASSGL